MSTLVVVVVVSRGASATRVAALLWAQVVPLRAGAWSLPGLPNWLPPAPGAWLPLRASTIARLARSTASRGGCLALGVSARGRDARPVWQALPGFARRSTWARHRWPTSREPSVNRALLPFHASAGLAVCKTLANRVGLDSQIAGARGSPGATADLANEREERSFNQLPSLRLRAARSDTQRAPWPSRSRPRTRPRPL